MMSDDSWHPNSPAWAERLAFVRRVLSSSHYELSIEDREELAQESLVDLFERSRSERPRNPEGLLRTIAHRKAVDLFRERKRWRRILVDGPDGPDDLPDARPSAQDQLERHLLESLPAIARTYFERNNPECLPHARTYFEDGSWKVLARDMDARVNTVTQQWIRCRSALVTYLRKCGFGWATGEGAAVASSAHALARIPAYRLGLLEASEALDVREHLRSCEECRQAFEPLVALSDEEEKRPGHLPIALITRWDTFAPLLTEDERACLEEHFESCPRCKEGRAFARLIPDMPELRSAPARRAWLGFGTGPRGGARGRRDLRVAPTPADSARDPCAFAGRDDGSASDRRDGPARAAPHARGRRSRRSGHRGPRAEGHDRPSHPRAAALGVGPDARIRIRVEGPGGVEFGHAEFAHKRLFGTSETPSLDAQAASGPLPEGVYRVLVTSDVPNRQAPRGFEGAEYGFDLRTEAAK
jgi:DNA-directed RNA polymerase specialized sigma24 family protein